MFAPVKNATTGQLAAAANAALRAETHNMGIAEIPPGASSVTLLDPRFGTGRYIILIPVDAAAGLVQWHMQAMRSGEADIVFANAPQTPVAFAYAVMGVGTPQGEYHATVLQND